MDYDLFLSDEEIHGQEEDEYVANLKKRIEELEEEIENLKCGQDE